MSRFCEQCGTPLEPNENFCSNCGAKVIRDEPPQPTYTPPVNQPSPQTTYTPPKSTPVESTASPAAENKMVNFLVLLGILLFIGVGVYFAINKQSDEALGEFYLGMSKDEVDRKLGAGTLHQDGYGYRNENYCLQFDSNNKVNVVICYNETVKTKKGIHIGSTIGEIKRAYGSNYQFVNDDYHPEYIYTIGNSVLVFFIDKETNRVRSIVLETTEETSLSPFYLGMSKAEADRNYGAGTPEDGGYNYPNGNYWLHFDSNNKAERILCWNKAIHTKRGIRVGSTLDEVKRAYGNDYEFDGTTFKETPAYIYTLGNSQLFFFVDKETNRVNGIRLDTLRR